MAAARPLLERLKGGDRRSIGASDQVVREVVQKPELFAALIALLTDSDPVVAMRAADAAEKISARHPEWLVPHTAAILALMRKEQPKEVKWHLAQMAPRLKLAAATRRDVAAMLFRYLEDDSRIVQTFALQSLADLAEGHATLRPKVAAAISHAATTGGPALRTRARKLLATFAKRIVRAGGIACEAKDAPDSH